MKVLGIETSCDETAISLIEINPDKNTVTILGNTVHSQIDEHVAYGGVFPMLAKREHEKNLVPVLLKTLDQAGSIHRTKKSAENYSHEKIFSILSRERDLLAAFKSSILDIEKPDIDYISVTKGPGLEPALWVGISFARALSKLWNIPLVPVNHMEGHILAALIKKKETDQKAHETTYTLLDNTIPYPALSLLISGGHTQIILVERIGSYKIVGETLDDAVGECFDKVARMLGLTYPGGPKVSKLAAEALAEHIESPEPLPRPMIKSPDLNFSFSGLKTAVLYLLKRLEEKGQTVNETIRKGICREVEDAITDVLIAKMRKAIEIYGVQTLVIGGGVIANTHIRQKLEELARDSSLEILLPQTDHSTDNGLMIALAGYFNKDKVLKITDEAVTVTADGTMPLGPRG